MGIKHRCKRRRVRGVTIAEEERSKEGDLDLRSPPRAWLRTPNPREWDLHFEAIASLEATTVHVLGGLVVSVPDLAKYLSAASRERFYLKFLEQFLCSFDGGTQHPPGLALVIDLTFTCEQLVQINYGKLQTVFGHDTSNAGLCSHELHQFVVHKRATLPSPSLYLDLCQADSPPMELSGLSSSNGDYEYTGNDGGLRFPNQSTADLPPDNSDVLLQNDPSVSQQHSIERNVSDGDKRSHPNALDLVKCMSAVSQEWFYLKYLEEFLCSFDGGTQHPPGLALVIDLTFTCDQVVRKNFKKLRPVFGHDMSNAGLCSLELHQFVVHKQATLPSPSLYLDLCLADLLSKELSSLSSRNGDGEYTSADDGLRFPNQSTADLPPDNSDLLLQNDPPGSQQHCIERNASDGDKASHPHGGILGSFDSTQHLENNSTKTDIPNDGEIHAPKQSPGAPTHDADNAILQEDCGSRQNMHKNDILDVRMTSNQLHGEINGVCVCNIQLACSIPPIPCKENGSVQDTPLIGNGNTHADDIGCSSSGLNAVHGTQSHGDQIEDSSLDPEPRIELADAVKQQSLSSQVGAIDDSLEWGRTGKNLCIKCDKGGELLCCSISDCAVVVHKSCLGLPANFDNKGLFCCPSCTFQKVNSEYRKTRDLFLQTGENCMDFFRAISAEVDREKQPLTGALQKISQELGAGNLNCQFDFEKAREEVMGYLGARLVDVRKEKQPLTGALRKKSQESVIGTMNCQSDCEINSHQSDNPMDALPEAKEQFPNAVMASAGEGGASSGFVGVSSGMGIFDVSPDAEMNIEKAVNSHQDATEMQHNQLTDKGTVTNDGILPCEERIPSIVCQDKDVNLNSGSGVTNTGNVPDDEMDPYHGIHVPDASKGKTQKRLRNKEQAEDGHDLGCQVLTSIDGDKIVKRGRHAAVVGRCHLPQGSVEDQCKENSSPGRSGSHKKKEQVENYHDEENAVISSSDTDRFVMRGRHSAVVGRSHLPQDTTGDQKKGNPSPRSKLNREKKAKKFSNSTKLPGCGRIRRKWDKKEEEFLLAEVQKVGFDSKIFPWKKIWESGQHVFQDRRQGDLKDKWKNIRKRMEQQQKHQQQQQEQQRQQ